MELLQELTKLGWRTRSSGGEKIAAKQDGDSLLQVIVQHFELSDSVKLALSVSASSKEFGKCCAKIMNEKSSHEPLCQTYLENLYADLSKVDVQSISDEVESWWKVQAIEDAIKSKSQPPPETGQAQLYHLAALAYLGDFNTLMDYQQVFAKGQRMGFVPMIEAEMIDRAVDIALERA